MANPIDTQTDVKRITISGSLGDDIKNECDIMGAAGYLLSASFVLGNALVLIFQIPRQ